MILDKLFLKLCFYTTMVVECVNLNSFNQVGSCRSVAKSATKYVSNPVKTDEAEDSNNAVVSKDGNTAIRNMALASLKLKKSAVVVQNGKEYNIKGKYKVIGELPTKEVNATWASRGYTDSPYKPNEKAQIIELTDTAKFVRTYDNKNSFKAGGWVMKYEDIKGLSPEEIADKFALPQVPKYVCDCTLEAGTKLCTGECNPLYGRKGGGTQFDLMGVRTGKFDNEREIGKSLA